MELKKICKEICKKKNLNRVALGLAFLAGLLYYFDFLKNIRSIISDITTFNGAIFSFLMIFFTLLYGMKEKDFYKKIKINSPEFEKNNFKIIQNLLLDSVLLFFTCLAIKIFQTPTIKIFSSICVFIFFEMIFFMCSGLIYTIFKFYRLVTHEPQEIKED